MARKRDIHVIPHPGGEWSTKSKRASRAGSRHATQTAATTRAAEQVKRERTEVVIHRPDRRIRDSDSDSYGYDPMPPLDKRH